MVKKLDMEKLAVVIMWPFFLMAFAVLGLTMGIVVMSGIQFVVVGSMWAFFGTPPSFNYQMTTLGAGLGAIIIPIVVTYQFWFVEPKNG